MPSSAARSPSGPHESIGDRAAADLRFIRHAMERTSAFTAVPGAGGMVMGLIGAVAAIAAAMQPSPDRWLAVWLSAAAVGFAVGLVTISWKCRRLGTLLSGALARNFAVALVAPLAAGAGMTYALWSLRAYPAMPAAWLLMYGAGVVTGGMFSVRAVRLAGLMFMLCGFAAALTPPGWGNAWLGLGFGLVHIVSGFYIVRHHGG